MQPTYIIDTNVLIAGLLTRRLESPTVRILDAMLDGSLKFLLSSNLFDEYRAVILRKSKQIPSGTSQASQIFRHLIEEITTYGHF